MNSVLIFYERTKSVKQRYLAPLRGFFTVSLILADLHSIKYSSFLVFKKLYRELEPKWAKLRVRKLTLHLMARKLTLTKINANFISWSDNRPFYPYDGHIELIWFKEYYRMPRGAWAHFVCILERSSGHFFVKFS